MTSSVLLALLPSVGAAALLSLGAMQGGTTTAGTCYAEKSISNGHVMVWCTSNPTSECAPSGNNCIQDGAGGTSWCDCKNNGSCDDPRCDATWVLDANGYPVVSCSGDCWTPGTGQWCQPSTIPPGMTVPACKCTYPPIE